MQREGDGGGGVDESRCRREKSTFGRPAQTHAKAPERWLLAVLEDFIG